MAWPEVISRFSISPGEQSITLRTFYNQTACFFIQDSPWIGIGLGNFVLEIRGMIDILSAWTHQPVHNIYLLIGSEVGLIGLFLFLMFVYQILRQFREQGTANREQYYLLLFIVLCFLFVGLFDHFFWTLQQGQLLFWLILGLLAGAVFHNLTSIEGEV